MLCHQLFFIEWMVQQQQIVFYSESRYDRLFEHLFGFFIFRWTRLLFFELHRIPFFTIYVTIFIFICDLKKTKSCSEYNIPSLFCLKWIVQWRRLWSVCYHWAQFQLRVHREVRLCWYQCHWISMFLEFRAIIGKIMLSFFIFLCIEKKITCKDNTKNFFPIILDQCSNHRF